MSRALNLTLLALLAGCPGVEETDTDVDTTVLPPCLATPDNDADADGVADECDRCVGDDLTGDRDADGVCDDLDPCPLDDPDDSDGDGVCDINDVCIGNDLADSDGDGVPCNLDCDDTDPNSFPMATWFLDGDEDGFGDEAEAIERCEQPVGYVAVGGDCDDEVDWIHPDATEWCDGIDTDCNPLTSEPARAAHLRVGDAFTDITGQFTEGGSEVWTSTGDGVLGLCGIDGNYAFDIAHDVQVVGVNRPVLTRSDRPVFQVGTPGGPTLDPAVRLSLSGVSTIGSGQALVNVQFASADLADVRVQDSVASLGSVVTANNANVTATDLIATGLDGRAFNVSFSTLSIADSRIEGFNARANPGVDDGDGGALFLVGSDVDIRDSVFINNRSARRGGAIFQSGVTLFMDNVQFESNASFFVGGGVFLQDVDGTMVGVEFTDSLAFEAGALYLETSTIHGTSLDFIDNSGAQSGGAVRLFGGTLIVDGGNFIGNHAAWSGGAVFVGESPVASRRSVFRGTDIVALGNEALGGFLTREGGGAFDVQFGTMSLTNATLRGNRAPLGAAVHVGQGGSAMLDGPCSITSNVASGRDAGSGALHVENGTLLATSCTFGDNVENFNAPRPAVAGTVTYDDAPDNNLYCIVETPGIGAVGPMCELPATLADDDSDGVHDLFDRCPGESDLADDDENGLPCWIETIIPE